MKTLISNLAVEEAAFLHVSGIVVSFISSWDSFILNLRIAEVKNARSLWFWTLVRIGHDCGIWRVRKTETIIVIIFPGIIQFV